MNDFDCWVYLDGPEPERLCQFLDAIRELPPLLPEDEARMDCRVMAALDAALGFVDAPAVAPPAPPRAAPPAAPLLPAPLPLSAPAPFAPQPPSAGMPPPLGSGSPSASPAMSIPVYPPPPPPPPPPQPLPPVVRAAPALVTTAPLDRSAVIPSPAAAAHLGPEPPKRYRVADTLSLPVLRDPKMSKTKRIDDNRFIHEIAAAPSPGNAFAMGETPKPPPQALGTGNVPVPHMAVETYGYYKAELARLPAHSSWVRERYEVPSEAAHRALEAHWDRHFAELPEDRRRYDRAFAWWMDRLVAAPPKQR